MGLQYCVLLHKITFEQFLESRQLLYINNGKKLTVLDARVIEFKWSICAIKHNSGAITVQ